MSKAKLSIFAKAIFNVLFSVRANNYCKLTCDDGQRHTMCMYPNNTPSPTCTKVISTSLTSQEKDNIVKLHNKLRQHVAKGRDKRGKPGPQPAAKNMPNLQWDSELEMIAQRWANQCNFDHDCCNIDVGQNLAKEISSADDCRTIVKYRENGDFITYLVCNYGEAGNVENEPLYERK